IYDSRLLDGIYTILAKNKLDDRRLMRLDRVLTAHLGHTLAREVERAKIALSGDDEVAVSLDWIERRFELTATRDDLNDAIAELLDTAERELPGVIRPPAIPASRITAIFFTGGGSCSPRSGRACGGCCRRPRRSIPIASAASPSGSRSRRRVCSRDVDEDVGHQ